MEKHELLAVLKREVVRTTGCTDPGTVALTVAHAVHTLGRLPERTEVTVSPNIYKNAVCVGIPGTGERGLNIAVALGAILANPGAGLAILEDVDEAKLNAAHKLLAEGGIKVGYADAPNVLYVKVEVFAGTDFARAVISGDYTNVVEIVHNDEVLQSKPLQVTAATQNALTGAKLSEMFDLIQMMTLDDLAFLVEAAHINRKTAEDVLSHPEMRLGPALNAQPGELPPPFGAMHKAQLWVSAAAEARMHGLKVPVMAVAGSGNQGICSLLGILGAAEALGCSPDMVARALAFSALTTVFVQSFAARMTAFCGGAISAATGVAGGVVYLLGGSFDDIVCAMQTMVGTVACVLCDGAKESCAYKLGSAVATAIETAYLALEGVCVPDGSGIVGRTIEETFENLGLLNNQGMIETEKMMLQVIEKGQRPV